MKILSPVTHKANVRLIREVDAAHIISNYQKLFSIDVSRFFIGLDTIKLYRCLDTGYRFFTPETIAGDGSFYEHFQKFEWYYMDWKWEHEVAASLISPEIKFLEVGCGAGAFLEKMTAAGMKGEGLELNKDAVKAAKFKKLKVYDQSVEEFADKHEGEYDLVCSFQVLEHISKIESFVGAQVKLLKKGGLLIVSVPNNDSFLSLSENFLNLPPHHMGLWNKGSLVKLGEHFNLETVNVKYEPLQDYHRDYFLDNVSGKYLPFLGKLKNYSIVRNLVNACKFLFSDNFKGFTIQVVYRKV